VRSGSIAVPAPRTGVVPRTRRQGPVATGLARGRLQRETHAPEYAIVLCVVALAAIGILMVYSSSGVRAYVQRDDTFAVVGPQLLWALLGVVAMVVMMRVDYRYLRLVSIPLYAVALVLLALVLLPGIGIVVGGSARWLQIGTLPAVHPAEFAKLALVVYLAHWLAGRGGRVRSVTEGTLPFLALVLPAIVLVVREPDLGTTGVLTLTAFTMFWVAGANLWQFLLLVPAGVTAVGVLVATHSYQLARVQAFLDPWKDPQGIGFHTIQGLLALGLGGLLGAGLGGHSLQAGGLDLPNASNDFIFAVIGEEFGLLGGLVVVALFALLAFYGMRVALAAPDTFGGLLATGITAWLTVQAFVNIGVVVALVPITGITLPFVSAGGSSLIVSFAAVGILLSISRETQARGTWNDADPDRGGRNRRPYLPGLGRGSVAARPARGR
jgi:cell division protein FtsW